MAAKTHKAHVLILPYPSQGHINPLLQFAKRLASKGVKATIATTHYTVASISSSAVSVEAISDGFDVGGFPQAKDEQTFLQSFKSNGSRTLSSLVEKFEFSDCPVTCIVYDSFLPWALDVAKSHGVYGAAFFTNSATVCSIFCRVSNGEVELGMAGKEGGLDVPGLPHLGLSDLPTFLRFPESYPTYLAMKMCQYTNLEMVDWIFSNSFQELESKEAASVKQHWPAKLIGPMIPSAYLDGRIDGDRGYGASLWKPLNEECMNWLESKPARSVAFISFGSMVALSDEQMGEIAELLAHEATGCFVTHCGWNSTLEALSLGVPMVAMPQWTDQVTNAKYVEDVWKVGVRAKEDESGIAGREEIGRCLKEVMLEGDRSMEIKEAAKKWRKKAVDAVSKGGDSDKEIDSFVKHLMKGSC
ncbi:UDP-glycosyltransferase 74B1 [Linum perenne]